MSWQAVDAVMERSKSTGTDRMVLMVIATFADKTTFDCSVGIEKLSAKTNLKPRTLQYAIERLKKLKELHVAVGKGRGNVNFYTLNMPIKDESDCVFYEDEIMQPVASFREIKDETERTKRRNPAQEKTQPSARKDATERVKDATGCTRTIYHNTTVKKPLSSEREIFEIDPDPDFELSDEPDPENPALSIYRQVYKCGLPCLDDQVDIISAVKDLDVWTQTITLLKQNKIPASKVGTLLKVYRDDCATKAKSRSNGHIPLTVSTEDPEAKQARLRAEKLVQQQRDAEYQESIRAARFGERKLNGTGT